MKNIRDLKCNAIRLDLDSKVASQKIAIDMIADYQELWDCSVKDAIVHLLCDYHQLIGNSGTNTQYILHHKESANTSHKPVTPDKVHENKEQPASLMEKEKIQVNKKTIRSNINEMVQNQDITLQVTSNEENTKEEDIPADDPWAEIIAKNKF